MPGERPVPQHRLTGIGDEAARGLDGQLDAVRRFGCAALEPVAASDRTEHVLTTDRGDQ